MLKKRFIFTLLFNNGSYCLSRNFRLHNVGKLSWLLNNYKFKEIAPYLDEIVILNVSRDHNEENFEAFKKEIKEIASFSFIPLSVGGHLSNISEVDSLFKIGADKVVLNTALFKDHAFVKEVAKKYGKQAIIASLDVKKEGDQYIPYLNQGTEKYLKNFKDCLEDLPIEDIGEIFLTSIDKDGTGQGYEIDLLNQLKDIDKLSKIPVITNGGAGNYSHFESVFSLPFIDAASTANLLNFLGNSIPTTRIKLLEKGFPLANWNLKPI